MSCAVKNMTFCLTFASQNLRDTVLLCKEALFAYFIENTLLILKGFYCLKEFFAFFASANPDIAKLYNDK